MPAPPLQSEPAMVRTEGDCAVFSDDMENVYINLIGHLVDFDLHANFNSVVTNAYYIFKLQVVLLVNIK